MSMPLIARWNARVAESLCMMALKSKHSEVFKVRRLAKFESLAEVYDHVNGLYQKAVVKGVLVRIQDHHIKRLVRFAGKQKQKRRKRENARASTR